MSSVKEKTTAFLKEVRGVYVKWCETNKFSDDEHILLNFWLYYQLRYIKKLDAYLDFGAVQLARPNESLTEEEIPSVIIDRFDSIDDELSEDTKSFSELDILDKTKAVFEEVDELADDVTEIFKEATTAVKKRQWYKFWKRSAHITEEGVTSSHLSEDTVIIARAWMVVSGEIVDIFTRVSDDQFYSPRIDLEVNEESPRDTYTPSIYESNRGIKRLLKLKNNLGKTSKKKTLSNKLFVWSIQNFSFQQLTRTLLPLVDSFGEEIYEN